MGRNSVLGTEGTASAKALGQEYLCVGGTIRGLCGWSSVSEGQSCWGRREREGMRQVVQGLVGSSEDSGFYPKGGGNLEGWELNHI